MTLQTVILSTETNDFLKEIIILSHFLLCFICFIGTFEQSEFRQYLNGPPLEIEVHDRDRKAEEVKLKAALFGDDLEDEKISNVGTVASES